MQAAPRVWDPGGQPVTLDVVGTTPGGFRFTPALPFTDETGEATTQLRISARGLRVGTGRTVTIRATCGDPNDANVPSSTLRIRMRVTR